MANLKQNPVKCFNQRNRAGLFDWQGSRKYLNRAERKSFLRAARKEEDSARRAFCLALYYTGCRISEGLAMVVGRVDLSGKSVVFETLKQRKRGYFRAVPVPDGLVDLLREITAGKDASAPVWDYSRTTAYRLIKEKMAEAGVAGAMACPKGLRHGFAVACITQNIPITKLQKWLGHGQLETTAIYLDVAGDDERAFAKRLWAAD